VGVTPLRIQALNKASGEVVREWAAVSLGDMKAAAGAAPLARLLLQDPARAVRLSAATALGEIAAPESREALTQAARQDSDSLVRSRSEDALAKLPR
jgi:HEAT repeat protein